MRSWTRILLPLLAGLTLACEDEPSVPRGGDPALGGSPGPTGPPPAPPTAAASASDAGSAAPADVVLDAAPTEATEVASDETDSLEPAADVTPDVAPDVPAVPPRHSTTSQLLGLGPEDGPGGFAPDSPGADSLLFQGKPAQPSQAYDDLPVAEKPDISPLERHWGQLTDARKRELIDGTMRPSESILDGDADPEEPAEEPPAPGADEESLPLVMYKLGPNAEVQTYERIFRSKKAFEDGQRYARGLGFKSERPAADEIGLAKKAIEERKKSEAAPKPDACAFKANWVENGLQQQRCFPTQAALDEFSKKRAATPPPKPPAAPAPTAPTPPTPVGDIQPEKVGP